MSALPDWIDHLWTRYVMRAPGGCVDGECSQCAVIDCPSGDLFHYHHDGCPSCLCPTLKRMDEAMRERARRVAEYWAPSVAKAEEDPDF